jgi:hypothetical protein
MPRQIIDTETSRPAYVRRQIITWVVAILVILIVAFFVLELLRSHHPAAAGAAALFPGNLLSRVNLGPIPQIRRGHAA